MELLIFGVMVAAEGRFSFSLHRISLHGVDHGFRIHCMTETGIEGSDFNFRQRKCSGNISSRTLGSGKVSVQLSGEDLQLFLNLFNMLLSPFMKFLMLMICEMQGSIPALWFGVITNLSLCFSDE